MLKKSLAVILVLVITIVLGNYNKEVMSKTFNLLNEEPIKAGVFIANFDEAYVASVKSCLDEIQKENEDKIQFIFFDGKGNQFIQDGDIKTFLENEKADFILLNLVNQGDPKYALDRIKEYNIPVIFFGGTDINKIKSYNKAYWVGMNPNEGGIDQGDVIVKLWNNNKEKIDKNKDNIMQYVMLTGPMNDVYAIERTKYSILTVNKAGIRTQELAKIDSKWSEEEAKNATKAALLKFGNNIEMIVVNNDYMALGAIKALQERGYNTEYGKMYIPVVGFDGIQEAKDLIKKRIMAGTVVQEPCEFATALYMVGMNLVSNKNPIDGTEYKTVDSGISIIIPYQGIMIEMEDN